VGDAVCPEYAPAPIPYYEATGGDDSPTTAIPNAILSTFDDTYHDYTDPVSYDIMEGTSIRAANAYDGISYNPGDSEVEHYLNARTTFDDNNLYSDGDHDYGYAAREVSPGNIRLCHASISGEGSENITPTGSDYSFWFHCPLDFGDEGVVVTFTAYGGGGGGGAGQSGESNNDNDGAGGYGGQAGNSDSSSFTCYSGESFEMQLGWAGAGAPNQGEGDYFSGWAGDPGDTTWCMNDSYQYFAEGTGGLGGASQDDHNMDADGRPGEDSPFANGGAGGDHGSEGPAGDGDCAAGGGGGHGGHGDVVGYGDAGGDGGPGGAGVITISWNSTGTKIDGGTVDAVVFRKRKD